MLRLILSMVSAGLLSVSASVASGQAFPSRPIRIVTSGVGGAGDFAARIVAQGIIGSLGQQVVVDNRPSGVIPGEIVAKAPPDGYTLLLYGSVIWLTPLLRDHVPFDPLKDLAPITLAVSSPNILVVHPSLPATSVGKLIALARAKPGLLNFGTSGAGSSGHLAGELFKAMAGIDIVRLLERPEVKESFLSSGSEVVASTPQQLAIVMRSDIARMGKVIKDAGIRIE